MRSDFFLFVLVGLYSSVAATADLPDSLLGCSQEVDEAARLACYDREIAKIKQPAPIKGADAPVSKPAIITEEAAPSAEKTTIAVAREVGAQEPLVADFGKDEQTLRSEREQKEGSIDEMSAIVVSIIEGLQGKRTFTLDNGQVWAEKFKSKSLRLEPGDTVRIKSGAFGSFKIFGSGKSSTRVERVH